MKKHIISIGRQYGCGAHEIALKLAQELDIPYYDKEIIKRAAEESGFDEHIFAFYDERPTRSYLYSLSVDGFTNAVSGGMTLEDRVFQYQFDAIRKCAAEGSCIIVGRCADYILREEKSLLTVFLHADIEYRKKRAVEQYGIDEKNAVREIKSTDRKRARFHNFYSDKKWGDASAYDLTVNVAKFGTEGVVKLIADYIKSEG